MKPIEAYGDLRRIGAPIFSTREAAARLQTSVSNASHSLRSMEDAGLVRRVRQGLWSVEPDVDPVVVPPYLTAPFPAYISFWSALARHDMIEQIPRKIFVASLDRSRQVKTSLGIYSIHHLAPELFSGYEGSGTTGYIAVPEKALFDTVYIHKARGARISFPELSLPVGFDRRKLAAWADRISTGRLRTQISSGLQQAVSQAEEAVAS